MDNLTAQIPLTKGKYALVDLEDYPLLSTYKWQAKFSKGNWYATHRTVNGDTFIHNIILPRKIGLEPDHINQNGLDNRRCNLRYATRSQNRINVSKRKDNKSGYKGVSLYKPSGKWRAYIQKDYSTKHLGFFNSKEEAALAYNEAASKMFGEYAWLNPIP